MPAPASITCMRLKLGKPCCYGWMESMCRKSSQRCMMHSSRQKRIRSMACLKSNADSSEGPPRAEASSPNPPPNHPRPPHPPPPLHSLAPTPLLLREHVHSLAWRYIQCEQRYLHLFHKMLQGVVLVKDLDSAKALLTLLTTAYDPASNGIRFETVVTLGGEVLHVDGWLSGGSGKDGAQQGLLAYEREL